MIREDHKRQLLLLCLKGILRETKKGGFRKDGSVSDDMSRGFPEN